MEELFQTLRTEDFEKLFFVLEDIIHKYGKSDKIFQPLLRISNNILNKLSRTSHTNFIGRIHKLIANVFPLSHRSGVNFKGIYNERITIETEDQDTAMETEDKISFLGDDKIENTGALDYEFYKNFWLLQKYFSDPFQVRFEVSAAAYTI